MDIRVDSNTAIVFDLDDTLYNELDYLKSAYRKLAEKLAPDTPDHLFVDLFSRYRNQENTFEYVSQSFGIPMTELLDFYRNHNPDITPFNGVKELLEAIKTRGGKVGIITDGRSVTQRNKIQALQIDPFIDHIVISEEIGTEKPNEQNYRRIERQLQCRTHYYIGDNLKKDFITPNKLGWNTVGLIDNGLNIHSNAYRHMNEQHMPQELIFTIEELKIK